MSNIDHRLTFGQFNGQMLSKIPDWYLRLIAKNEWAQTNESVIFEAAKRLLKERSAPAGDTSDPPYRRAGLDLRIGKVMREALSKYHPDRAPKDAAEQKIADRVFKAINELRDSLEEVLKDL